MAWKPPATDIETTAWTPPNSDMEAPQQQMGSSSQPDSASNLWGSSPELQTALSSGKPIWNALNVPSQMSKRGLSTVANAIPTPEVTGNLPLDLVKGTPKIVANTMAQAAPDFINRASLLTGITSEGLKAVAPLAKAVGSGVASQVESLTGAVPGSVKGAFNDASLMFAKGKSAASPLYDAAKAEMTPGTSIFSGMYKPEQIVDTAKSYINKGGVLEPAEALIYRKAIDSLAKSGRYVKDELFAMRGQADAMAKASDNIAQADPLFQRGRMADSLRQILPQNKYGGASAFKLGIMAALESMGIPGKVVLAAMSPAAAGTAATLGGIATRAVAPVATNPGLAVSLSDLYHEYVNRKNQKPSDLQGSALDVLTNLE